MSHTTATTPTEMAELDRERRMGGQGTETTDREVRRISLADFENRRAEITDQLWSAATDIGFFQVVDHGIDLATVDHAFDMSARFFDLPRAVKEQYPLKKGQNAGWEYMTQVRPSVGTPDQKESYSTPGHGWTRCGPARRSWPDSAAPSRISNIGAGGWR